MSVDSLPANVTSLNAMPPMYLDGAVDSLPLHTDRDEVHPSVVKEVESLAASGLDVALVDPGDSYRLSPVDQVIVDAEVSRLENMVYPMGHLDFSSHPAMTKWMRFRMQAISLHPLYGAGDMRTLGEGISPAIYDQPLFPKIVRGDKEAGEPDQIKMLSAREVAANNTTDAEADETIAKYTELIKTDIDPATRAIFMGTMDGRAIRTRANAAMDMAAAHFSGPEYAGRKDLVSASLACGAAGPVYNLVNHLRKNGLDFSAVHLVDQDEMALASAKASAEAHGVDDLVDIQLKNLLAQDLTDYIKPGSVDVVDLLGLFEYIPTKRRTRSGETIYPAQMLLEQVKKIVKPGGLILFGNMLDERPQQKFFSQVVKWPRLHQRSITEVLEIVEAAGFAVEETSVRVPSREGVYAVFGIRIPENEVPEDGAKLSTAGQLGHLAIA